MTANGFSWERNVNGEWNPTVCSLLQTGTLIKRSIIAHYNFNDKLLPRKDLYRGTGSIGWGLNDKHIQSCKHGELAYFDLVS